MTITDKTDLGIIIVNWNNKDTIIDCLRSVGRTGYINHTIIVDNGSTDGSVRMIRKEFPEVSVLEMQENLGYSAGNNRGVEYLLKKGSKYIFILNPDTELYNNTVEKLLNVLETDKKIGIAGPKIILNEKKIWSCGGIIDRVRFSGGLIGINEGDNGQYNKIKETDYIPGAAMMVRREVFEKIGLFCEKYFIYYEDTELCLKAKKAGFKILFVPDSVVVHKESSSFGKHSPAHQYYMARNHLLFTERNAPVFIKLRELCRLPKTIWEHKIKQEKFALLGIKDYFLRRFGKRDYWS